MDPVTRLDDLDVTLHETALGECRLDVVDERGGAVVISLPANQASWLAIAILAKLGPRGAGWPPSRPATARRNTP